MIKIILALTSRIIALFSNSFKTYNKKVFKKVFLINNRYKKKFLEDYLNLRLNSCTNFNLSLMKVNLIVFNLRNFKRNIHFKMTFTKQGMQNFQI